MDWKTFIANITDSLAWPLAMIIIVLLFRKPLFELIPFIKKFKFKELEIEFEKELEAVAQEAKTELADMKSFMSADKRTPEDMFHYLIENNPIAAISNAWLEVEKSAIKLIKKKGVKFTLTKTRLEQLEGILVKENILDRKKVEIFKELRLLRNKATHIENFVVTNNQAKKFVVTAMLLSRFLDSQAEK